MDIIKEFFDNSPDLHCVSSTDGRILRLNESWVALLGNDLESIYQSSLIDFVHPDDRAETLQKFYTLLQDKKLPHFVNRVLAKDGSIRWLEWSSKLCTEQNWILSAARDITDQKRDIQLMQKTERMAQIGGWELTLPTGDLYWTQETYRIHEVDPKVFRPRLETALDFYVEDSKEQIEKAVEAGINEGKDWDLELEILTAKGKRLWVRAQGSVEFLNGKAVSLRGTFQNIHEKKLDQIQRLNAQKVELIGSLAGGIAHDFNNLMAVISGHAALLSEDYPTEDRLKRIQATIERANSVTRQLLMFSRPQKLERKKIDLNAAASEVFDMVERLIGEEIKVEAKFLPGLLPVMGDHSLISQVLLNLCVNARDAMPQGGKLKIETVRVESGAFLDSNGSEHGIMSGVRVTDTGFGMSPEVQAKIFDPFFTTKEVGKGTGLGLAVVDGIVRQLSGQILVESAPGQGTRMTVLFPALLLSRGLKAVSNTAGHQGPKDPESSRAG